MLNSNHRPGQITNRQITNRQITNMRFFSVLLLLLPMVLLAQPAPTQTQTTANLPHRLDVVVKGHKLPATSYGFLVQEVQGGKVLLDINPAQAMNPASTMKVLTTLAALERLGPNYTWNTDVYALGVVQDGTLHGDLLIHGGGDPFLLEEHVRNMLKAIQREGITHITGDLVVDASYFDASVSQEALIDNQEDRAYNVLPHALMSNFQVVSFYFRPHENGKEVVINADPPLPNLHINNRLRLKAGACQGYQRGIRIEDDATDPSTVVLSGDFPAQCQQFALVRSVLTPTDYFFGLFSHLWHELGGNLDGSLRVGQAPQQAPLLTWASPPLADVIKSINKFSNNMMTRQTLLTLGAQESASPATVEQGAAVVSSYLAMLGIDSTGLVISNGAGLSREARVSPALMTQILQHAYASPYMAEFIASLPVNGLDGTMRNRVRSEGMRGQMHIKTGSLDGVAAVAGFVQSKSGKRYSVVGMLNHELADQGPGVELLDALLIWVYEQ
jgi:serine-type D-Ala-D-Ala carboxypeptidase/endopeptidase (penicillin-binding protein 4)